ncbi:trypsin-2-like [Penaeus monodon]|uniref:trypsin-2-like n=1 Tax=Penaeus monodon TaxID=6687 RepID=UPI0018A71162|nr:trypsin-2-like [Penaeus monodon]
MIAGHLYCKGTTMKFIIAFLCLISCILAECARQDIKIAGGKPAVAGQFPWLVSIEATNFQESWPLCGGTLISPEWVLTAAHCLDSEKPEWLWVISGEVDRNLNEGSEQYMYVDYFIQHPDYIYWQTPYLNDVGLIHLSTPAILDSYTNLPPLPTSPAPLTGPCWEAGWGATAESAPGSDKLLWAEIDLLASTHCEAAYNTAPDPNAVCAGNVAGGAGACVGDNGGGLMCLDGDGYVIVGGIMSWREGCAQPGKPAVYMDIYKYSDWIIGTIQSPGK